MVKVALVLSIVVMQVADLEGQISTLESERNALQIELTTAQDELETARNDVNTYSESVAEIQALYQREVVQHGKSTEAYLTANEQVGKGSLLSQRFGMIIDGMTCSHTQTIILLSQHKFHYFSCAVSPAGCMQA